MSLSPLTKNNQKLDISLMKFIVRQVLIMYSITFVVAVLGIEFASRNSSISFHTLILFFCTLPLMIMIFRNHAKTKLASDNSLMAYSLLCLALIIILELIYFKFKVIPVWILCLVIGVIVLMITFVNWKKLINQKNIFPVGRSA